MNELAQYVHGICSALHSLYVWQEMSQTQDIIVAITDQQPLLQTMNDLYRLPKDEDVMAYILHYCNETTGESKKTWEMIWDYANSYQELV